MRNELENFRQMHINEGLTQLEWEMAYSLVSDKFDKQKAWKLAIQKIKDGVDLVPSIIEASFKVWPEGIKMYTDQDFTLEDDLYKKFFPEIKMLNTFRDAVKAKFLGGWYDFDCEKYPDSYCQTNDQENAINIIENIINK